MSGKETVRQNRAPGPALPPVRRAHHHNIGPSDLHGRPSYRPHRRLAARNGAGVRLRRQRDRNVVSAFLLGLMLGHVLIGPISDIIGKRRSILYGLAILSAGAVLCAVSPHWGR